MKVLKKKRDISHLEFMDYCKDGLLDLVKSSYEDFEDKHKLLTAKDNDEKTCFHLVSLEQNINLIIGHLC